MFFKPKIPLADLIAKNVLIYNSRKQIANRIGPTQAEFKVFIRCSALENKVKKVRKNLADSFFP